MTGREFAEKYNTSQLAESIVIRDYVDGCSRDTRRAATEPEREIIKNIAYGAMLAYLYRSNGGSIDSILDMAEFTLRQFIPEANTYDTIYIPLRKVMEKTVKEENK